MPNKIYDYGPAASLDSQKAITTFMADAFETGDVAYIAKALGVVARAKGMTKIAKDTGLSREQLYRSFSDQANPTSKTTLTVMQYSKVGPQRIPLQANFSQERSAKALVLYTN